jgi:hypothetical protein
MRSIQAWSLAACAVWFLSGPHPARGDGCGFWRIEEVGRSGPMEVGQSGPMAASPKQEAILIRDGSDVRVILRTHFRAGGKEMAWVLPVPSEPTSVEACDDKIFDVLERETGPSFYSVTRQGSHGLSCGCGAWENGEQMIPPVRVERLGTAGVFEYAVLSSRDANELTRWLNEHQYRVPPAAPAVFERYVKDGWHWLAMRLRPEVTIDKDFAPHPVTYTYHARSMVYPLVISQLSAERENEIVLYVVAPGLRYGCTNWSDIVLQDMGGAIRRQRGSPSGTNYEELLREDTKKLGGHLFVTEYAGPLSGVRGLLDGNAGPGRVIGPAYDASTDEARWITRMRAVVAPEAMDRDVVLSVSAGDRSVPNRMQVQGASAAPPALALAAPLAPLVLAGVGVGLRRRPGPQRRTAAPILALACLAFAML